MTIYWLIGHSYGIIFFNYIWKMYVHIDSKWFCEEEKGTFSIKIVIMGFLSTIHNNKKKFNHYLIFFLIFQVRTKKSTLFQAAASYLCSFKGLWPTWKLITCIQDSLVGWPTNPGRGWPTNPICLFCCHWFPKWKD